MPIVLPAVNFSAELLLKAQGIRAAFFPMCGALTTRSMHAGVTREASLCCDGYDRQDINGLQWLQKSGCTPVILLSGNELMPSCFPQSSGIKTVTADSDEDYRSAAESWLDMQGLSWQQAAVMGYDWQDLALMRRAAVSAAAADAHLEVKTYADHVGQARSGHGAARSFCDLLLTASGRYAHLLQQYAA